MKRLSLILLLLVPVLAFSQNARDKYQQAKAAEYRSDHSTKSGEQGIYLYDAFVAITEATAADPKYMNDFARITFRYTAMRNYSYMVEKLQKVGQKSSGNPIFKGVVVNVIDAYKKQLWQYGFAPSRSIVQNRKDRYHCNALNGAVNIYELLWMIKPGSLETEAWGEYAANFYMTELRGCGGGGGTRPKDPLKAFEIYNPIQYKPGMHTTGKILGDDLMEEFIFGGTDYGDPSYKFYSSGHYPFRDKAFGYYRKGGVTKSEIRATLLRYLREAEKKNEKAALAVAQQTLNETF